MTSARVPRTREPDHQKDEEEGCDVAVDGIHHQGKHRPEHDQAEDDLRKLYSDELEEPRRRRQNRQHERPLRRMRRNGYVERLRTIPAFRHCSRSQLEQVARLVDVVELPASTVELDGRELVVTLDPVRALVVGRQAVPAVLELAPDLVTEPREEVARRAGSLGPVLRLRPA